MISNHLIEMLINESKKATHKSRHASLILGKTKKKKYIIISCNKHGIHAECNVIRKVKRQSILFDIYVTRVNNNNDLMLSKPCEKCKEVIISCGFIKNLFYTDQNGNWIKEKILEKK